MGYLWAGDKVWRKIYQQIKYTLVSELPFVHLQFAF
jgi:hypothetical protein